MTTGDQIVTFARQQIGKPYVWGATGPNSYDCSGLVYAAYKAAGLNVPRSTAATLGKTGTAVSVSSAVPGDVVYYDEPGATDHVGIYIGNGQMIDAPTAGKPVELVGIGRPTSIRHLDGVAGGNGFLSGVGAGLGGVLGGVFGGNSSGGASAGASAGGAVADAAAALNPFSLFSNWQSDALSLGLKVAAAGACAALVIVGAREALQDRGQK